MSSQISNLEMEATLFGAAIGAGVGFVFGSKDNKTPFVICGAIAGALIANLVYDQIQKRNLKVICATNANQCLAGIRDAAREIGPEVIATLGACGSGQLVPCLAKAVKVF